MTTARDDGFDGVPSTGWDTAELTVDDSLRLLAEAVGAFSTRRLSREVSVSHSGVGQPGWHRLRVGWSWVAPVVFTVEVGTAAESVEVLWPARWTPDDAVECPTAPDDDLVLPGCHDGLYLGQPLVAGHGVRLREGIHLISRPTSDGWRSQLVLSPSLGVETFGKWVIPAVRGRVGDCYLDPTAGEQAADRLRGEVLAFAIGALERVAEQDREVLISYLPGEDDLVEDGLVRFWREVATDEAISLASADLALAPTQMDVAADDVVIAAGQAISELRAREMAVHTPPQSRTAAGRNRLVGADEVMAELVFSGFRRRGMKAWRDDAKCAQELAASVGRAAKGAIARLARGKAGASSVVTGVDRGTTLARVEQSARTCFNGFRGLPASLRGRADLRDLDPGWRGVLCPVQTPESTDVGLVRYTAVGGRGDAPEELREWFDLSASAALIPFVNHNDPARASIGSKNLKQAVAVSGAEPPMVATGWERVLANAEGAVAAPATGRVTAIESDAVSLETADGVVRVGYGAPYLARSGLDNQWTLVVGVGESVVTGQTLAHAPDVVLDPRSGKPELALGVNALVALTPWHGLNFEDAIVVSESFAARMTSRHIVRIDEQIRPGDDVQHVAQVLTGVGGQIEAGQTLATVGEWWMVGDRRVPPRSVESPVAGEFLGTFIDPSRSTVSSLISVERRLSVGDKLSNRHQGKGVISAILPDPEMPRAVFPDGTTRAVEVILNPLGVLRRLNVGQLWEMHTSLLAQLNDAGRQVVGRVVSDPEGLARDLEEAGAPLGRLPLHGAEGAILRGSHGVVVGWQYILKLDHLATGKLSVRGADSSRSPVSGQPTQTGRYRLGERVGAAQRIGEMEVWALEAAGATSVLSDALTKRAGERAEESNLPRASLRSVQAHLSVAGFDLATSLADPRPQGLRWVDRREIGRLSPRSRGGATGLPPLPGWEEAGAWPRIGNEPPALDDLMALSQLAGSHWAEGQGVDWSLLHPLYRPETHGSPGSLDAEEVRFVIPLPLPMPHPWDRGKKLADEVGRLEPLTEVPVLPPAYRIAGASALDRRYQDLAIALARRAACIEWAETNEASAPKADREAAALDQEAASGDGSAGARREQAEALRTTARKQRKTARLSRKNAEEHWATAQAHVEAIIGAVRDSAGREVTPDPDSMLGRLGGKRGLLRRFLLGQSVTHSGRSVIVPDTSLRPFEVGLPEPLTDGLGVTADGEHGDVVLVNRQPSIQPYNVLALRARRTEGDAVRLHPLVIGALAGDFDGDTVAVHRPILPEARRQAWELLSPQENLRSAASRQLLAKLDLDVALGIHLMAGPRTPFDLAEAIVAGAENAEQALLGLAALEEEAWDAATGWSVGALDLLSHSESERFAEAVAAGVAGKESARAQLLVRRGVVEGGYPGTPVVDVAGRFLTGLTNDDYFLTSPGALASLAEKKLTSPHAGALTKSLVEIADAVVIAEEDCDLEEHLRSPLTCQAVGGVCSACYGPDPGAGTAVPAGSRVGVLAAMLIGARSSELSMKVFHGGGQKGELGSGLATLKAIFGYGKSRSAFVAGGELNLRMYLDGGTELADPERRLKHLSPLVDAAVETLGGGPGKISPVDAVHIAVVLRQLYETWTVRRELMADAPNGPASLMDLAQQRGRTRFELATTRGSIRWLKGPDTGTSGGFRTRLATGDVR